MSEDSRPHSNPRRYAQLISSPCRFPQSHSKRKLTSTTSLSSLKGPGSKARTATVRRSEIVDVVDAYQKSPNPPDSAKTVVSRRRISAAITPQTSIRAGRKANTEKENINVEDTPSRQTVGRSTTSGALRRTAMPLGNPSPIKINNASGSKESCTGGIPRSTTSILLSRKPSSALAQKTASTKSRTAFSLKNSARSNRITVLPNVQCSSDQSIRSPTSLAARVDDRNLPPDDTRLSLVDSEKLATPRTCFYANPSVGIERGISETAGDSQSSSAFAPVPKSSTVVSGRSAPHDSVLTASESSSISAKQLIADDSNTDPKHMTISHSMEAPLKSVVGGEKSFELTGVPIPMEQGRNFRPLREFDIQLSSPADVAKASLGGKKTPISSGVDSQPIAYSDSFSKLKHVQGTKSSECSTIQNLGMDLEKCIETDVLCSQTSSQADIITNASPKSSTPSAPPPTPALDLSPTVTGCTSSKTSTPPSIFPRLFAELATTKAHLGLGVKHVTSSSITGSTRSANDNSQAERTQKELATLRAGGSGLVLARARMFGQTLWTASSVSAGQKQNTVVPIVEPTEVKELVNGISREEVTQIKGDSDAMSGSNQKPPPPPSPGPSSTPNSETSERSESPSKTGRKGRRVLGCADLMGAVAMAQYLWKAKNFVPD